VAQWTISIRSKYEDLMECAEAVNDFIINPNLKHQRQKFDLEGSAYSGEYLKRHGDEKNRLLKVWENFTEQAQTFERAKDEESNKIAVIYNADYSDNYNDFMYLKFVLRDNFLECVKEAEGLVASWRTRYKDQVHIAKSLDMSRMTHIEDRLEQLIKKFSKLDLTTTTRVDSQGNLASTMTLADG
jgi:hypothetical protein